MTPSYPSTATQSLRDLFGFEIELSKRNRTEVERLDPDSDSELSEHSNAEFERTKL